MYKTYRLESKLGNSYYIGMTKQSLIRRLAGHRYMARSGKKTPLYDAMRKYGIDSFEITLMKTFSSSDDCKKEEVRLIFEARGGGVSLYNVAPGGEGGFVLTNVDDIAEWKAKLRVARVGRKPAAGMTHTDENKKIFSLCGKKRWDIAGRYPADEIVKLSHVEAKARYGISTTHYYRLRHESRARSNDSC